MSATRAALGTNRRLSRSPMQLAYTCANRGKSPPKLGRCRCSRARPSRSHDAAPIFGRRPPRQFVERRCERARLAEAHIERDLGHRLVRFGKKGLCPLDAPAGVIAVRWHTEGPLERPRGMKDAQLCDFREFRQRDLLAHIFLDVLDDRAPLPTRKPTSHRWIG